MLQIEHQPDTGICVIQWGDSILIDNNLNVTVNVTRRDLAGLTLNDEVSNSCSSPANEAETLYYLLLGSFQFVVPLIALGIGRIYRLRDFESRFSDQYKFLSMDQFSTRTMKMRGLFLCG